MQKPGLDSQWQLPKANPEGLPSGVQQLILLSTNSNFQLNTDLSAFWRKVTFSFMVPTRNSCLKGYQCNSSNKHSVCARQALERGWRDMVKSWFSLDLQFYNDSEKIICGVIKPILSIMEVFPRQVCAPTITFC